MSSVRRTTEKGQRSVLHDMDAAERAGLITELDGALASRIHLIAPTPRLHELYRRDTWTRRSRIVRAFLLWAILFNIAMCGLDYIINPSSLGVSLVTRLGFLTTIWSIILWAWMRPRQRWLEGVSLPIIVGTMVLAGGVIGVTGGTAAQMRYLEASLLSAAPAIIILPMARVWTIAACVTALSLYGVAALLHPLVETKDAIAFGIFSTLIIGSLVPARHAMNCLLQHGYMLTLRDALKEIALREANERLSILATTDELTGLPNRRAFETMARTLCRQETQTPTLGVMLLDIDHFKQFNDAAGHGRGDACLIAIAGVIREALPEARIVARYGGEEFAVLFTDVSPRLMMDFAEKVRQTMQERALPHPGLGAGQCVTVSIGLSLDVGNGDEAGFPELVRQADDALYRSKEAGRNRYAVAWMPSAMILNTHAL